MDTIRIKKGLDLPIGGAAERRVVDLRGSVMRYAVKPTDVVGLTPRLLVAEGDHVAAGSPLVADKADPRICLTAPVNGTVVAVVRGEKRKLLEVVVEADGTAPQAQEVGSDVKQTLLERGAWWMLRERPFGIIACPDHQPKGIFVSLIDTNPLAPDMTLALAGREHDLEAGLQALATLAPVHVCIAPGQRKPNGGAGCTVHTISGPHPAGNIGTQIAAISPINKGECVWTVGAQDVANIGALMLTGVYAPQRVVAVAGPAAKCPKHYRLTVGAQLSLITEAQLINPNYPMVDAQDATGATRVVSGSVLSGTLVQPDGYLGMYDQQVSLLAEGDQYEFMGWLMPGLKKFSFSRTFVSGMLHDFTPRCLHKELDKKMPQDAGFNTNVHGSVRPFLFTGQFERVFPFDIYPLQLIKACIVGDMELQEQLGIYEVEPEDFALCEFIDPSKNEIQQCIREALEILRKEATA